ncbi:MAG TPA: bis-aminopropyl spermidine synthase family protein [Chloroflexia bacterium]|nr:bis-aminopropyl spermidine synthase family protein [Chloroflexia bacterium]
MADFADKQAFLKRISDAARLRQGPRGVESVLRAIFDTQHDPTTVLTDRLLARVSRMPVPVISAIHQELEQAGVLEPGSELRLTNDATRVLTERWGWHLSPAVESASCPNCEGTGVAPTGAQWEGVLASLRRHTKAVPEGGRRATPEANLRRTAYMHGLAALSGKDVLVIGEDVSVSAAIALAGKVLSASGRLARRVVALHTDERALTRLRDIAVAEGAIIGLVTHNLYHPLPKDLQGEFDTVIVDPPYTLRHLALYVSRAVEACKEEKGRIFLSYRSLDPDERLGVQRTLLDMSLSVEQLTPGFNRYADGALTDFYYIRLTEESTPLIDGEYTEPVHPAQEHPVLNTYVCSSCHSQVTLVSDDKADIWAEQKVLNKAGCPTCGGSTMEPIYSRAFGKNGKE